MALFAQKLLAPSSFCSTTRDAILLVGKVVRGHVVALLVDQLALMGTYLRFKLRYWLTAEEATNQLMRLLSELSVSQTENGKCCHSPKPGQSIAAVLLVDHLSTPSVQEELLTLRGNASLIRSSEYVRHLLLWQGKKPSRLLP
jgi:hypothetical protein